MPQMAPINWLFLFFMFILTYLMFNIVNYYIYNVLLSSAKKKNIKINYLTWKW